MPEALWRRAATLADKYGLNPTARALGLNYYSLKRHLVKTIPTKGIPTQAAPDFIELLPGTMTPGAVECTLEWTDSNGATVRRHKILVYDGQGFWLCQKRLSKGRFPWWPRRISAASRTLQAHQLAVLLSGVNPEAAPGVRPWRRVNE